MHQDVTQADALRPQLLAPIFSFWSPIPTRTRTMTAQLQGNNILPFPTFQRQATLGAIKASLANVAIFVSPGRCHCLQPRCRLLSLRCLRALPVWPAPLHEEYRRPSPMTYL